MISINEALADINKQNNAPQSPSDEKPSDEGMAKWLVLLAAIIAIAALGARLTVKSRMRKKA